VFGYTNVENIVNDIRERFVVNTEAEAGWGCHHGTDEEEDVKALDGGPVYVKGGWITAECK
jgi:hypothetical protein